MNQYSVLLVDDEEFVYQVMMKKLNWEEMGFKIDGYARNGLEALELAEEFLPDVVMTDIKMPYMDGLTLAARLKEKYPNIKIIIFSGFDDFEYAREAIKLEAEEYILKPINSTELRSVFQRIKISLDKEISERRNIDKLQEYYKESLPVLQDNFCISLIEGRIPEENIAKYASDYQMSLTGPYYAVSVLRVSYHSKNNEEVEIAPFLLTLSVQKYVEEQLSGSWNCRTFSYLDEIVQIIQFQKETDIHHFTDTMDNICKMAKRICKASVTAGIGQICSDPIKLKDSFQGAKTALSHRVLYGREKAINVEEIDVKAAAEDLHWEDEHIHNILKNIRIGDQEEMEKTIDQFCLTIRTDSHTIQEYYINLMKLAVALLEFIANYDIHLTQIKNNDAEFLTFLLQLESVEELRVYLKDICSTTLQLVNARRQDSTTSFVAKAENYVKDNYSSKDMTIDTICGYLSVSSAYFSTAFKKATGKTFINYLTEYRMEQAVKLLETTTDKTYEIADKVGYSDPNYFSYVFKKQFGISPSKYRSKKQVE